MEAINFVETLSLNEFARQALKAASGTVFMFEWRDHKFWLEHNKGQSNNFQFIHQETFTRGVVDTIEVLVKNDDDDKLEAALDLFQMKLSGLVFHFSQDDREAAKKVLEAKLG